MREALGWSAFYIAIPLAFGGWIWSSSARHRACSTYTGYLVEKSLSVDNLFVFMLLLSAFAVPAGCISACCCSAWSARSCSAASSSRSARQ